MPFGPVGPDISSCPNFSARVILPISELTWPAIDASRCLVAADTPMLGCWAEVRAARLLVALVLTGLAVAAGTASSAAAASAVAPEAICAARGRHRGLRIVARPPCQIGDGPTAPCPQPVKPVC